MPGSSTWVGRTERVRLVAGGREPPAGHRGDEPGEAPRGGVEWGFAAFFIGYGGYYLLVLVIGALLSGRSTGFDPTDPPPFGPLLVVLFLPNLLLGLVPLAFSLFRGRGPRDDFGLVPTLRDLWVGLACGAAGLFGSLAVGLLLLALFDEWGQSTSPMDEITRMGEGQTLWLVLFALFVLVGAPLTEELLVRGALWGALERYRVPPYAILLLTSLVFAFIHAEPRRVLVLFVGGLALGYARLVTGRVAASMVAHASINLLPALVVLLAG
ncbi:MAG TPA: CPBP family intramembrane glutamic endopeptidase [Pseudonocardiaceae bacterium]